MTFLFRLLKHLLILFFISLPLTLVGIVILPVCLIFSDIGALPLYLRWLDSADPYIGRDTTVITRINKGTYWSEYSSLWCIWFNKYTWLAFRNPINYFSYRYLSFTWNSPVITVFKGSLDVGDSTGDIPGFKYLEVKQDGSTFYEYYFIYKMNSRHCLRFRLGYKIGNPYRNKKGEIQQEVLVLQPYKSYAGN